MQKTIALLSLVLLLPLPLPPQELKHRSEASPRAREACIAVSIWRDDGTFRYKYLTGQPVGGDLNFELAQLKLVKGKDCRIDVILDRTDTISDINVVPKMAINAGYWDIHIYVRWHNVNSNMAEISFVPGPDGADELLYGPIQHFAKKHPPRLFQPKDSR